jgi:plastocyanin
MARARARALASKEASDAFAAKADKATPKVNTVPIKLFKDVWGPDEVRFTAGETVDFPVETAKRLIKAGAAERADPMPGDE